MNVPGFRSPSAANGGRKVRLGQHSVWGDVPKDVVGHGAVDGEVAAGSAGSTHQSFVAQEPVQDQAWVREARDEVHDLFGATSAVDGDKNRGTLNGFESRTEDPGLVLDAAGPTVESDLPDECESREKLMEMGDIESGSGGRHAWMNAASPDQAAVSPTQDEVSFVEGSRHCENERVAEPVELSCRYIWGDMGVAVQRRQVRASQGSPCPVRPIPPRTARLLCRNQIRPGMDPWQ